MIATFELDDLVAPGETASQPDARHGGFRSAIDHPDFFDRRNPLADQLRHLDFERIWNAETNAARGRRADRIDDDSRSVTEDRRAPGPDVVDVFISIDVPDPRAFCALDKERFSLQAAKSAHGRIHAARDLFSRGGKEI